MVREGGVEPPCTQVRWILSPVRLPVPPLSLNLKLITNLLFSVKLETALKATTGSASTKSLNSSSGCKKYLLYDLLPPDTYSPFQVTVDLDRFNLPRRCLASFLFLSDPMVGLVLRRGFLFCADFAIRAARRSRPSLRFRSCDLKRFAFIISMPLALMRFLASCSNRDRTFSGKDVECLTSKRSCTAVAALLTCWPPGPGERINLKRISLSSSSIASVTRTITYYKPALNDDLLLISIRSRTFFFPNGSSKLFPIMKLG
jgi:hypothetical protein